MMIRIIIIMDAIRIAFAVALAIGLGSSAGPRVTGGRPAAIGHRRCCGAWGRPRDPEGGRPNCNVPPPPPSPWSLGGMALGRGG